MHKIGWLWSRATLAGHVQPPQDPWETRKFLVAEVSKDTSAWMSQHLAGRWTPPSLDAAYAVLLACAAAYAEKETQRSIRQPMCSAVFLQAETYQCWVVAKLQLWPHGYGHENDRATSESDLS